jgi:hypothetical protein
MIRPIIVANPTLKLLFIVGSLADIEHFVFFVMKFIQKAYDLKACKINIREDWMHVLTSLMSFLQYVSFPTAG